MYQDHFGLHADPFALGPNLKFLFRSHAHAETMAHLGYGLEQGEDIILIVGAIGTGKTLALHNLQAKVSTLFRQALVNVTRVSYIEFLKLVLHELEVTWPPHADAADLLVLIKEAALAEHREGRKILLVVDEAQNLDVETLEGVRLLTNIGQPDKQLFQIVLAGQPGLEALIERPALAQLRQRIRIHYKLEPLTARETGEYIEHRTQVAGAREPLFTPPAIRRIHDLSGGIPRLVNHLAGHALLAAFVDKSRSVDASHVAAEGMPEAPAAGEPSSGTPEPEAPARPPVVELVEAPPPRKQTRPAPRPELIADPDADPAPPRRPRRAAWIWAAVAVLVVAGAWYMLRDGGFLPARADSSPPPATTMTADDPALAGDATMDEAAAVAAADTVAPPPQDTVWLHVASFRDRARADRYGDLLHESGCSFEQRQVTLADGQDWQRLLLGPFANEAAADSAATVLARRGLVTSSRVLVE